MIIIMILITSGVGKTKSYHNNKLYHMHMHERDNLTVIIGGEISQ